MAKIEKKLKQSEERFKALFKGGPIPTYAWQKTGNSFKLIDFNKAAESITQGNVGKFLGKLASKMYKDRPEILNDLNRCFNEKINLINEMKYTFSTSKEEKDLLVSYSYIPPDSVLVHTEDIAERKNAEQNLRESEEKFRSLVESTSDWIWEVDNNGTYIYSNPQVKDILGYEVNEIIGKMPFDFMSTDEADRVLKLFLKAKKLKKPINILNNKNIHKDGHLVTLETSGIPFFDDCGILLGYRGIDRDITNRIEAEQNLNESEEKYRSIFNNMTEGFAYHKVIVDNNKNPIDYIYLEVNPAFERLTGLKAEQMIGKKVTEILPGTENDPADWIGKFGKVGLTGVPLVVEDYSEAIDKWFKVSGYSPQKGYFAVTFSDITDQKKAEILIAESESKFRTIFEAIPDLYFLVSGDAIILDYRGNEQELYLSPEEFMGKKVVNLLPPNLGKNIVELIKKTLMTQQPQSLEYELEMQDGMHFYESRYFYISQDKVSIFIRDITERKNIEKQISDLAKFPSENPNPVLRVNKEKIIYINKAGRDLFNLTEGNKIPNLLEEIVGKVLDENATQIMEVEFGDKSYMFNITPILQEGYANIYGADITERKQSEIALNLEKKFADDILNSSMDTVFVFNPESGRAVRWNNVFKEVSGYSDEEIASIKTPESYYNEEDLKRASEAIKNVLEKGTFKVEISLKTKDGRSIPYEYTGTTLKNSSGDRLVVSVGRDISERKIAEEKIKGSEQKFRDLYEEAPIAYFSIGPDKSILRVNKATERLLGYEKDEFLKKKIFDLYPDTDYGLKIAKKVFAQFIAGESIKDVELQMANKEGNPIWISLSVKPILDPEGKVIESRSMVLDINDRKIAQEEVKNSYKKLEELEYIINNSSGVVFLWKNSEGWPVEFVSENITQFGYTPEDFYSGKLIFAEIIHPDDLERVSEEVNIYSNEDINNFIQEYRIITKSGEIRWLDDRTWIRRDSNGNITHYQGIVLDITDRKIVEEALKQSEKKYKEAYDRGNFYKDLFAHDMNNILQVVNSSAELITYQLGESEKSKEIENISEIIKKQVSRGSKLISNVRTLSELEEKEIITHKIEIGSVLRNSIASVEKAYEGRNVNISLSSIEGDYFTDANELLQAVFENVLINGIKYNEHSEIEILIRTSKYKKDTKNIIKLEFIDNGIGVFDNRKEVIFLKGNRELKGSKGMGLGLSLVSKILEIFKGEIRVEDKIKGDYSKGSNFIIILPEVE